MKKRLIIVGTATAILIIAVLIIFRLLVRSENTNQQTSKTPRLSKRTSKVYRKAHLSGTPKVVAAHLKSPWSIVFYNGSTLISSRDTGQIREVTTKQKTRNVMTISNVQAQGEAGLLGLAVKKIGKPTYLYAYYSTSTDNRIVRYRLSGKKGALKLTNPQLILSQIPLAANHNGGRIAFGPDGRLYVATGDAGNPSNAQNLNSLAGKILRMTPSGGIPSDNPFKNSRIYSYGHRNVQGLAWDSKKTLYATEFGENTWDELNVIQPGKNYGWPTHEGKSNAKGFVSPVQQWSTSSASPSGMAYYNGVLFIANLRGEVIRSVAVSDLNTSRQYYQNRYGRIRDIVISPNQDLYFLTNNTDGRGEAGSNDDRLMAVTFD